MGRRTTRPLVTSSCWQTSHAHRLSRTSTEQVLESHDERIGSKSLWSTNESWERLITENLDTMEVPCWTRFSHKVQHLENINWFYLLRMDINAPYLDSLTNRVRGAVVFLGGHPAKCWTQTKPLAVMLEWTCTQVGALTNWAIGIKMFCYNYHLGNSILWDEEP